MAEFFQFTESPFRILEPTEIVQDGDVASEDKKTYVDNLSKSKAVGLPAALAKRAFEENFVYRVEKSQVSPVKLPEGFKILPVGYKYITGDLYLHIFTVRNFCKKNKAALANKGNWTSFSGSYDVFTESMKQEYIFLYPETRTITKD